MWKSFLGRLKMPQSHQDDFFPFDSNPDATVAYQELTQQKLSESAPSVSPATPPPNRGGIVPDKWRGPFATFGAAVISGGGADLITFPASTVKTNQMAWIPTPNKPTPGIWQMTRIIVRNEGVTGLYNGILPVMVTSGPGTIAFFSGMTFVKSQLGDGAIANLLAGLGAQLAGSGVWVPCEVIKEGLQTRATNSNIRGTGDTAIGMFRHIVREEGVRGLYRGIWPQMWTFGPFNAGGMMLSGTGHRLMQEYGFEPNLGASLLINTASFFIAGVGTTPIDVIKTQRQLSAIDSTSYPDKSVWGCVKRLMRDETKQPLQEKTVVKDSGVLFFRDKNSATARTVTPRSVLLSGQGVMTTQGVYPWRSMHKLAAGAAARGAWLGGRQGLAVTFFMEMYNYLFDLMRDDNAPEVGVKANQSCRR